MNRTLLRENESSRRDYHPVRLLCFALFVTWQMGMVYFSGTALSVDGRTPLPVDVGNLTLLIAVGYSLSILFMCAFPRRIVWAERIAALAALAAALGLFLPLPAALLAGLLYVQLFCCVLMIGFENAIIIHLLSEKSAVWHLLVAYPASEILVAVLQNDFFRVPFAVFRVFAAAALVLMLVFFFKLPGNAWPRLAKREDGPMRPKRFFAGTYLLVFLSSLLALFGGALSETVLHGVSVYYLAAAAYALLVFVFWKCLGVPPMRSITVLMAMAALGFAVALVSLSVPVLALPACVLLAAGMATLSLSPLLGLLMFRQYPSRWISPIIIALAFAAVLIQSVLLEALRDAPAALHTVYLMIAVAAVILYLMLEPYLLYSFRRDAMPSHSLSTATAAPDKSSWKESLRCSAFDKLTATELVIAEHILRGYTSREIAAELNYSENTIKSYRKDLYSKLQIHSKRELFELAENPLRTAHEKP